MQRLRARIADIQLIAMKLSEPERFEQQERALADDVAERSRETVRKWVASQLSGGNPPDVPLEAIDVDSDNAERLRPSLRPRESPYAYFPSHWPRGAECVELAGATDHD